MGDASPVNNLLTRLLMARLNRTCPSYQLLSRLAPQRVCILLQLLDESKVGFGRSSPRFDVLDSLCWRPPILRYEKRTHHACAAADSFHAVDKDTCVRIVQCTADEGGCGRKVCGELGEWKILERVLSTMDGQFMGYCNVSTHCGENVGDAEGSERRRILCEG